MLNSYRKAMGAVLKCQLIPVRSRPGGRQAFEAFAADEDTCSLGDYLGIIPDWYPGIVHLEMTKRALKFLGEEIPWQSKAEAVDADPRE